MPIKIITILAFDGDSLVFGFGWLKLPPDRRSVDKIIASVYCEQLRFLIWLQPTVLTLSLLSLWCFSFDSFLNYYLFFKNLRSLSRFLRFWPLFDSFDSWAQWSIYSFNFCFSPIFSFKQLFIVTHFLRPINYVYF